MLYVFAIASRPSQAILPTLRGTRTVKIQYQIIVILRSAQI